MCPALWRWPPSSGAAVDPGRGLGRAVVGTEVWGWLRSPLRMGTSASRRKGLGSQCGVEAARRPGGAPGQRMRLRDRLGMLADMAGPHGKSGPGGPGLLPGNWGLRAPRGAWGRSRAGHSSGAPSCPGSQMELGARTVVGSCTEPACRVGVRHAAGQEGASVSPRRGGRPASTAPAEPPGAPPALGNQAKHEPIPIPVCQEGPWGAYCSPLSGHG